MSWREQAVCKGMPLDIFFPDYGNYKRAKEVCAICDVRMACLESVLRFDNDLDGMFGGYTPAERAIIREKRRNG